jgi:hypothetical protein
MVSERKGQEMAEGAQIVEPATTPPPPPPPASGSEPARMTLAEVIAERDEALAALERLRAVARRYDHMDPFETLWPTEIATEIEEAIEGPDEDAEVGGPDA